MFSRGILLRSYLLLALAALLTACTGQGSSLLFSFATDIPENLTVVVEDRNVSINWDSVDGASSYTLFRYTNSNCATLPDNHSACDSPYRWYEITVTEASDPSLLNDTVYYYQVMAHSSEGNSELSKQVSVRTAAATPPPGPQNLQWQLVGAASVELTWDSSADIDYYIVYRVTDYYAEGCSVPDLIINCGDNEEILQSNHIVNEATWTDNDLTPGVGYHYVAVAFNDYGSGSSNTSLVQTKPSSPTMTLASLSNSGLQLEWTSEFGASSYELMRYTEAGCLDDANVDTFSADCPDSLHVVGLEEQTYLDALTNINASNTYYRLRAANSSGYSLLSAELSQDLPPSVPNEFNLSSLASGTAHYLQWSSVLLADYYIIYRYQDVSCALAPDQCPDSKSFVVDASELSYTDSALEPGIQYHYSMRAANSWYAGGLTPPVDSITAPVAATNVVAVAGDGTIELTWDENANSDATVYSIYRDVCAPGSSTCIYRPSIVGLFQIGDLAGNANSFSDTGLDNAESYYYIVNASAGAWDVNSSTIAATTNPKAFTNLIATATSAQSVALSWENPNDNQDDASNRVYVYPCDPDADECTPEIHELEPGIRYSHEVENLAAGTRYYFKVAAYTDYVEANSSIADSYTATSTPTNITFVSDADGSGGVISWQANNGAETMYSLEIIICASDYSSCDWDSSLVDSTSANSVILPGLYPGSAYEVRVIASVASYSSTSATAMIYTNPVALSTSANQFTITNISQNSVTLNWDTSLNGDNSQYIPTRYVCDLTAGESCSGLPLVTFTSTTSSYIDSELSAGSEYSYKIRVLNDSLDIYSDALHTITTPAIVTSISAVSGDRNISLSWVNASTSEQSYAVYQSERDCSAAEQLGDDNSACGLTTIIETQVASATFTSLLPATGYYYRIVAQNATNGLSSTSDLVTGTTWPEAPTDINWTSTSDDITITWDTGANGDVAIWRIYRYPCDPADSSCFDEPLMFDLDYANNEYIDSDNLIRAQEYYYQVSVIASSKEFIGGSMYAMLAPSSIEDLRLTAGAINASGDADTTSELEPYVELNWGIGDNTVETNYTIYRQLCDIGQICPSHQLSSHSGAETYFVANAYNDKDVDGYTDDLIPATTYYYVLSATNTTSTGRIVETLSSASVITYPAVAQSLSADSISASSADINWSAGANGSAGIYSVRSYNCLDAASANCSDHSIVNNLQPPGANISGLDPASYYAFAVTTYTGSNSITSNLLPSIATQPVAITDITATTSEQDSSATIATSWSSANGEAAVYTRHLEICLTEDLAACNLGAVPVEGELGTDYIATDTGYTWTDTGLQLGTYYRVIMSVESGGVELDSSAVDIITLPHRPYDLAASTLGDKSIELQWNDGNNNDLTVATSYQAYAFRNACTALELAADIDDDSINDCAIVEEGSSEDKSYTFTELISGNEYYFAVRAVNISGSSWVADDGQIQATTETSGVSSVSFVNITSTSFEVSVNAAADEPDATYSVYLAECDASLDCGAYAVTVLDSGTFSHTYTNRIPGQHYSVIASASAAGVESNSSAEAVITLPVAVTGLTAQGQASGSIDISFTSANGSATTYQAQRHNCGYDPDNCASAAVEATIEITGSSHSDGEGLNPATYYYYIIIASANEQDATTTSSSTLTAPAMLDISNAAISEAQNSIEVTYDASTVAGVIVSYYLVLSACEELSNCGTTFTSAANATSVLFEGLTANSTYYLRSAVSNATATAYSEATELLTLPVTPTSLMATTIDDQSIELSWTDAADDLTSGVSYQAYAFTQACTAEQLIADIDDGSANCGIAETDDVTIRSHTFTTLSGGTTYNFAVRATNTSGSSWVADAEQATATTTSSGVSVAISNIASTSFDVNLSATNEPSTTYSVYLAACDSAAASDCSTYAKTELNTGIFDQSYTGLIPGQYYSVIASATAAGIESNSTTTSVVTSPIAVSDLSATPQTSSSAIDINYTTANGSAATYTAYRYNCVTDASCASASVATAIANIGDSNYTDTAPDPATYYSYIVGVTADGNEANASAANPALTAPAELIIDSTTVGEDRISVDYVAPSGALDYYRFLLSESNCTDEEIGNSDATCGTVSTSADNATSPVLFDNLTDNTTYYLRSVVSNATATIYSATTDLLTLPVTPTGLTATAESISSIKLEWSASGASDEAYAFTGDCDASALAADIADDTSGACGIVDSESTTTGTYIFIGLASGTTYNFAVRSFNSSGGESWSAQISGTTASQGIEDSITTANVTSAGFDISITAIAADEPDTIYSVYLAECDATPTCDTYTATPLASGVFDHSYTDLISGQHYSVRASASAGGSESNSSTEAIITLPVAVTDLTAEGQASGAIDINYTTANGSATTYTASRYKCGTDPDLTNCSTLETTIDITTDINYTDTALDPATYYYYTVSVTADGEEETTTTSAPALTAPAELDIGSASVSLGQNNISVDYPAATLPSGVVESYYLVLSEANCSDEDITNNDPTNCVSIETSETNKTTSVSFDTLAANTTYYLRSAVKNDTAIVYSDSTAYTTLPATPTLNLVGAHQSLEASLSSDSTANTGFILHLSDSSCPDYSASSCSIDYSLTGVAADTTLTLTNGSDGIASDYFTDGATYYAAVEASNSSGFSVYSAEASATTILSDLTNISASGATNSITLNWDTTTGAKDYHARVYGESCEAEYMDSSLDNSGGGDLSIAECGSTTLHAVNVAHPTNSATVSGLDEGSTYYYRIGASSSDGSTLWSDEYEMDTLPAAVTAAKVGEPVTGSAEVNWTNSTSSAITRHDVYSFTGTSCDDADLLTLASSIGETNGSIAGDTNCPEFNYVYDATSGVTVSGLATSTTYYFRIAAVNRAGSVFDNASLSLTTASALSDPLAPEQWHLDNTGSNTAFASDVGVAGMDINYTGVPAGITGDGVRVNVIDSGLEMQHPDLLANILADGSYDFVEDDNDPTNNTDTSGDHGTSVAGIIAAAANGVGGVGVAPRASLQAFNYRQDPSDANFVASIGGHDKLQDTAIFNQSFTDFPQSDERYNSTRLDALSCFTSNGAFDLAGSSCTGGILRSGYGAIYVKAAGNGFADANDEAWCRTDDVNLTCYNANMDSSHTYPYQIVVGALNANGVRSSYSSAGSSIWLTAPGGEYGYYDVYISSQSDGLSLRGSTPNEYWQPAMLTTDQVGSERGYSTYKFEISNSEYYVNALQADNTQNAEREYIAHFSDDDPLSLAAPVVSGVIALMLEANASLSWRDVKHILASTARQVDASIAAHRVPFMECATDCSDDKYVTSSSNTFLARAAWATNAAGYSYHNWYGFGLVDAGAAVTMAQGYSSSLGDWNMTSVELSSINTDIPDADGNSASIGFTITDDLVVEAVQLDLQITHHYLGALAVVLESPAGTRSVLLTPYSQYEDDDDFDSTLLSNAFYGESTAGSWTLEVYDLIQDVSGDSLGILDSGTIKIYGHSN